MDGWNKYIGTKWMDRRIIQESGLIEQLNGNKVGGWNKYIETN